MSGQREERFPCSGAAVVPVRGEIDIATAPAMRERLVRTAARSRCACVLVDLSGITFFDASAVRALMLACRRIAHYGQQVVLAEPSPTVERVLAALNLDESIDIYPLVDMALAETSRARLDSDPV